MSSSNKKKHANSNSHRDNAAVKETMKQQEPIAKSDMVQKSEASKKDDYKKFDIKVEIKKCAGVFRALWNSIKAIPSVSLSVVKIAVSGVACVVVIAGVVIAINNKPDTEILDPVVPMTETAEIESTEIQIPLQQDAYSEVNDLMMNFYLALANGDMETVKVLKDYSDDTELITYEKKSEFIDAYNNLVCYTKDAEATNSYYVFVTYDVKFKDIETTAPGLNSWYVYTDESGSLKIDGDMEESISLALQDISAHDDVVDLFNKIDVEYKEAVEQDENLSTFLTELPAQIKTSVGEALALLEAPEESSVAVIAEVPETENVVEEQTSQKVKATSTVNVRVSDSEEADKVGKLAVGDVVTRLEQKLNGWSKVLYEGQEAYVKSDYLELISEKADGEAIGKVKANTNVNVRNGASTGADKLGMVQADSTFDLLEVQGDWYKINYNGQVGYVKAEFFTLQ